MKENDTKTTGVNYNIWKDKFLPKGKDPSDDYLPPEVKTYCQVVDGISKDNDFPIFVVPIYVPNDSVLLKNGEYTDGESGIEQMLREKSRINYEENKKRQTLYQQVSEHIRDLTDDQKPFGLLYVYHNDKVITHVEPYMHFFNQNDKHTMVSMRDLNGCETDIIDKQIYGEEANFISAVYDKDVKLIKDSYGRAVDNILINNGKEIYKNYFGCRILAIQFLLSCLKEKQVLQGVFNIERVNDIMAIKNSKSYLSNYEEQLDQLELSDGNIPLVTDFSRGILGNDFNKLHEVNLDTLATELCVHDKIREQYVNVKVNDIIYYISGIFQICDVFTASAKEDVDTNQYNIESLLEAFNKLLTFAKKQSAFKGNITHIDDFENKEIEDLGSKYGTVNNFRDEIKIRTRYILMLFIKEDGKIQSIMDNIFPKGDVKRWMKGNEDPYDIKDGLCKKIVHELLKVIYDVKETEINGMKQKLEKENIFRKAKDGKYYNVGLAKLGADWYAKYAGKKFLKEHNDIIHEYSQHHVDSLAYTKYKQCEHIEAIDETYNKIMEQKKNSKNQQSTQNNNANSKDSNDKINGNANNEDNNSRNFFKKIDNNELNGEDNKEETKKLKTSRDEENNKNEFVDVDDKNISEKSHDITDKQQEATDTTGNRCWPFGWCSSCNGCAVFNNEKQIEANFRHNT